MKKNGLTLMELMIVIIISSFIGLAITAYFVSEFRFRLAMQDRIALTREARIATNHMRRVLRFASSVNIQGGTAIMADIEGGHLDFIENDITIAYGRNGTDLSYVIDPHAIPPETPQLSVIATNISALNFEEINHGVRITLTAENNNSSVTLQTNVRPLGGQ